jgi:tetraacyldisaccharide 4'-kinase
VSVYGRLQRLRRLLYDRGWLSSEPSPGPTIAVGNIVWGGTGKTPVTGWLARHYLAAGRRVAILSRGYGRRSRGLVVVSDGRQISADACAGGDEPVLLARSAPGSIVVVAERRAAAARRARELGADFFLLDDGFQHRALRRDVDLVLVDANDPFGGGTPPRGRAREDPAALSKADILLVTRAGEEEDRASMLRMWNERAPIFHCRLCFSGWTRENGSGADRLPDGPCVSICAIASPDGFRATLSELGVEPAERLQFVDHHDYSRRDVRALEACAARHGAAFAVTTEKDIVKLAGLTGLPLYAAGIAPAVREPGFFEAVDGLLARRRYEA